MCSRDYSFFPTHPTNMSKLSTAEIAKIKVEYEERLSGEKIDEYLKAFKAIDDNGDGHLNAFEIGRLVNDQLGMGKTMADIKAMIKEVDTNNNGTVEFAEFLQMMAPAKKRRSSSSKGRKSAPVLANAVEAGLKDKKAFFEAAQQHAAGPVDTEDKVRLEAAERMKKRQAAAAAKAAEEEAKAAAAAEAKAKRDAFSNRMAMFNKGDE